VVAWFFELHDLWLAKAVASPPKDIEFCRAFVRTGHVDPKVLRERLKKVTGIHESVIAAVSSLLNAVSDNWR
jgi:hypothetical protein